VLGYFDPIEKLTAFQPRYKKKLYKRVKFVKFVKSDD